MTPGRSGAGPARRARVGRPCRAAARSPIHHRDPQQHRCGGEERGPPVLRRRASIADAVVAKDVPAAGFSTTASTPRSHGAIPAPRTSTDGAPRSDARADGSHRCPGR